MDVLRPISSVVHAKQVSRLLGKGYYPVLSIPRAFNVRIPTELGPKLSGGTPLPKVPAGTVDTFGVSTFNSGVGGTCSWGPVFYIVLWKTAVRMLGDRAVSYAENATYYGSNPTAQMALLTTYKLQYLAKDPARDTLGQAIDAALQLLREERRDA